VNAGATRNHHWQLMMATVMGVKGMSSWRRRSILRWEIAGTITTVLLGSLFHFVYEWTGNARVAGAFFPVNESVWEHLKLGFWPVILFGLAERRYLKAAAVWAAKAVAVYVIALSTVLLFYTYVAVLGRNLLVLDILIFVVSAVAGHVASYRIIKSGDVPNPWRVVATVALVAAMVALIAFTFRPPHLPIFRSPQGTYGI